MNGKKIGKGNKVILKHKDEIQLTTQNSDKCTVFHLDFTGVLQVVNCPSLLKSRLPVPAAAPEGQG